jgi:hypothetical protein
MAGFLNQYKDTVADQGGQLSERARDEPHLWSDLLPIKSHLWSALRPSGVGWKGVVVLVPFRGCAVPWSAFFRVSL